VAARQATTSKDEAFVRKDKDFSLIAAIAAIAIPNLIDARVAGYDSSAAASMLAASHADDGGCRKHILHHTFLLVTNVMLRGFS